MASKFFIEGLDLFWRLNDFAIIQLVTLNYVPMFLTRDKEVVNLS